MRRTRLDRVISVVMHLIEGPFDELYLVIIPNARWGRYEQILKDAT